MKKVFVCAMILAMISSLPACKKDEGCKLDTECPNGQICRNMKCETPADNNNQDSQAAPSADAPNAAKPTTPQLIDLSSFADNKSIRLEDLGLDVDYVLNDTIHLEDTTKLEIAAGVTIDMQSAGAGIYVNGDAALIIKGTAESPVVFKSTNSSAWSGLQFSSKNKDNSLNYLQILNADGEEQVISLSYEARVGMDHVTLDGSANNGIVIGGDAKFTRFTNNTIRNCKGYPLVLDSYAHIAQLGEGNSYENNKPYIRINPYTLDISQISVIKKQPLPYYLADGILIDGESGTLTIEPGVEFAFEHEKEARVGGSIQLKLEGTAENPVIMRGVTDEANFWNGLFIDTERPSSISGLTLANTGYSENSSLSIRDSANLTISNLTFKATEHQCMTIGSNAKITNKGGLTFEKCGKGNIYDYRIEGEEDQKVIADLPVSE